MAQRPPNDGGAFELGARFTDYASLDLTVAGSATGGMGLVVWGPNALRGGEMEALKLLRPDRLAAASSPEARKTIERQFEAEALTWCHLWPHQCVIATAGLTRLPGLGDLPVLQLEYAPNGSLRELVQQMRGRRQTLPLRSTFAWTLHVAAALAHIHQRDPDHDRPEPLVHCDLKLENVLLDKHGWAMVTDLGLTRAYAALAAETMPSMAPGAATPAPAALDHRALVAQLRADLQGQGLLAGQPPQKPDAATLFATRTLAMPPTQALLPSAPMGGDAGGGAAEELIGTGVAGSPPYMAPEQWRGLAWTVPATDLYAYGVLLYELFSGYDALALFPRDPSPYLTPECYAHALATGYDPYLLAWHAAHTDAAYRAGGWGAGAHRLSDPQAREAALRSGPCAELLADGSAAGRQRAEACLAGVDTLIERCLAYAPAARPDATEMVEALQALVVEACGLEPIPIPQAAPDTPRNTGAFWSNLGTTYGNLGQAKKRLDAQRRALDYDAENPGNWINLGNSLARLGEQARQQAEEAPQEGEKQRLRAEAQRRFEEALEAYRTGQTRVTPEEIARSPALPVGFDAMEASVLGDLGRYGEAVAAYRRALARSPDEHDIRFNLTLDLARWSQVQDATSEERVERLQAAQGEIAIVLAAAPEMRGGRSLAARIAQALADPAHRFQGWTGL